MERDSNLPPRTNLDNVRAADDGARGRKTSEPIQDCCDRCGSVRLIRVKACWRCESCGYKSDCNGW